MRALVLAGLLLAISGCADPVSWQAELAAAIGDELAPRLAEPLARATNPADVGAGDLVEHALEAAIEEMRHPDGVSRVVLGSHSGFTSSAGYSDVSFPLVIVPTGDAEYMFCMVFAMSSNGELVAEPVPGDPINRCADSQRHRFLVP